MYQLRKASRNDFDFVFRLNEKVYKDYIVKVWGSWDEQFQKQFCENRFVSGNIQIIYNDEKEIGVLELIDKKNQIYIEEIQLETDSQGRAIGSEIIENLKQRAFKSNCSVGLMVLKINYRARVLYERIGFKVINETETHYIMEVKKL